MEAELEHKRIRREKRTITAMIRIYCRDHHGLPEGNLCAECGELHEYAQMRLTRCRYQEQKPTCGNCPVHCYKPSMKERVMKVMSYSGPRMTFRHPYYAIRHLFDGLIKAPEGKSKPSVKRTEKNSGNTVS